MNKLLIESNRHYVKKQVAEIIEHLFNDIKKMAYKIDSLEKDKKRIEQNRVTLARAYAKAIGVIITQKEMEDNNGNTK
ncbi:MAG: hypothetical protein IIC75_09295 [Bacteroidetes bacterium]|nr:hypothetical protein [Bacteroidota bacterium]